MPQRPFSLALALLGAGLATPAAAHHPMGGASPETLLQGLLSGLGHPVIGPDHLAFLLAAGLAIGVLGLRPAWAALFVLGSTLGVVLGQAGIGPGAAEPFVAASLVAAGALLLAGRLAPRAAWPALLGIAGVVHGAAFAEAVIGAEATPVLGYLAGLALVQSALAVGTALLVARRAATSAWLPRPAGAALLLFGAVLLTG